jgi:hypothetical protein
MIQGLNKLPAAVICININSFYILSESKKELYVMVEQ